jgi:DNA-binding CsgD family transcriptional regulator
MLELRNWMSGAVPSPSALAAVLRALADVVIVGEPGEPDFQAIGDLFGPSADARRLLREVEHLLTMPRWPTRTVQDEEVIVESVEIATCEARYRLRRVYLSPAVLCAPEPLRLTLLERQPSPIPTAAELSRRFALTARESEVAALLASRLSTAEVAQALGISPHTARRHVEAVLRKLHVRSRRLVANVVRGTTENGPYRRRHP